MGLCILEETGSRLYLPPLAPSSPDWFFAYAE